MKKFIIVLSFILTTTYAFAGEIIGAGATFPYPLYAKWASLWEAQTGNKLNYQSIGSGGGIKQIQVGTVTFGATDMPLKEEDLNKMGLIQFPVVRGANVIAYNVEGVKDSDLNLNDQVLADIYLGKITKWNDEAIKKLNPTLTLPDASITVVRRSDGSGTTYIFTKYLSGVSVEWKDKVGMGASVEWIVGIGAKGNEGVASNVKQTKNSIGYVEYSYAKQNVISVAKLNGILPNIDSFKSNSWPITAPTYILMYKKPQKPEEQKLAFEFFRWAFKNGDNAANDLDYVPLSLEEKEAIMRNWNIE